MWQRRQIEQGIVFLRLDSSRHRLRRLGRTRSRAGFSLCAGEAAQRRECHELKETSHTSDPEMLDADRTPKVTKLLKMQQINRQ